MDSKCRRTQEKMLDWFYQEEEEKDWDPGHVAHCMECQNYYQQLQLLEQEIPRKPLEFQVPEDFASRLADKVRQERSREAVKQEKTRVLKELGVFPAVALLLLVAMGSLFYYDIGPSFILVQLVGLLVFPLIIPIMGVLEKKRRQGRDSYGS